MISFLEKFIEFLAAVKIALSPILIFTVAGALCFAGIRGNLGIFVGLAVFVLGLVIGIYIAIRIHKKHGAVNFNSHIMATPEPGKKDEEQK